MRTGLGINEVQNFGKYRVTGRDARGWLDRIMAGRHPRARTAVADADAVGKGAGSSGISPSPACRRPSFS